MASFVLALSLSCWALGAHASRGFQPAAEVPVFKSLRYNATTHGHHKRWVAAVMGDGDADVQRWPDQTVTYGYANADSESKLAGLIADGLRAWDGAGLKSTSYKWHKVSTDACNSDRANCLMVTLDTTGIRSCTMGVPPRRHDQADAGPTLKFDINPLLPDEDLGLAMAHEMGHAWGLNHEHQHPGFWDSEHTKGQHNGKVFDEDTFACYNLPNYDAIAHMADTTWPGQSASELMCTDIAVAQAVSAQSIKNGLGPWVATAYLPFPDGTFVSDQTGRDLEAKDVNWESIMIYPSIIYPGKSSYALSKGLDANGQWDPIAPPKRVSQKDVNAVEALYGSSQYILSKDPLPNQPSHPKYADYKKLSCDD